MPATCNNSLLFKKHFVKVFHGIFAVFIYFLNISAVCATGSTGKLKNIFIAGLSTTVQAASLVFMQ
jgi:hypothetical protein